MCELCDDDRVTVVIAGELPADEPDNLAMIARDLSALVGRWALLPTESAGGINKWVDVNRHLHAAEKALPSK